MKRFFFILAVALAAFACASEEDWWQEDEVSREARHGGVENPFVKNVHFRAEQTDTKAQFGELENGAYPTLWTSNDSEVKLSLNYATAVGADVIPSADFRSATFDATFDFSGVTGPYCFYSVSPASAAQALSPSREAWKVSIPCEQTPTAGSVDEAGIILASTSAEYVSISDISEVDLYFTHLTAYGRMSLSNLALADGESVSAVELTLTTPIVGDWYWNTSGTSIVDYGASSTLTINTTRTSDIWFACAPVDVSGEMMSVTVFTNLGYYEQLVEFPAERQFTAGQAAVFSVDMAGAEQTLYGGGTPSGDFTLVTDESTLQVGDELLIVYTAGSKAMGASAGNYRNPVDITISNGTISSTGDAVVLTLCAGSTNGTWAFKDGDNYLASQSASSNYLQNATSITDYASWDVSISGGLATLHANAGARSYMLYNGNQPRFACYDSANKSGMSKVSIYRRSNGGSGSQASADDPLLQRSDYGCYLGTGLEWVVAPGSTQVTREYDANGVQTYTLIDTDEVEELEIVGYDKDKLKGDSFTVWVHWRKGVDVTLSESYTVTLIKEAGPKVWLSTGNGNGFIIKK